MSHTDRVVGESKRKGFTAPIESLEGRLLLSGGGHHGGGFKFRPNVQRDQAVADFNGDKKADIATLTSVNAGKHFSAGAVVVQLGQGDGTFKASALKVTAGKATAIVAGDFNDDGKQDLALAGVDKAGKTQVTLLIGDGTGKFTSRATQTVGVLPLANLTAADLDGDGASDLVSFTDTNVYAAVNNGTGTFLPAVQQPNPLLAGVPAAVGDIDGDGKAELIGVSGDTVLGNRWFTAQQQFALNFPILQTPSISLADKRVALGDVNGDGKADLIAIGDDEIGVALQTTVGNVDPTFGAWVVSDADVDPEKTLIGDVDGDGKVDLVRPAQKLSGVTRAKLVLISNGDGTFHKLVSQTNGKGHGDDDDDDDRDDD
jgi:hypothetical protein